MDSNPPEDISLKKEASYTYWAQNNPNQLKKDIKPKKVDQPDELQLKQQSSSNSGFSSWNVGGTWEEKAVKTEEIQNAIEIQLATTPLKFQKANLFVTQVTSVTGEAHLFLSRGKKRISYHLAITYQLTDINAQSAATIKYSEFTDDGDRHFVIEDVVGISTIVKKQIEEEINNLHELTKAAIDQLKQ